MPIIKSAFDRLIIFQKSETDEETDEETNTGSYNFASLSFKAPIDIECIPSSIGALDAFG